MTTPCPTLSQRLRERTQEQHRHAESRPLQRALAQGTITPETYGRMLGQRRLVHAVLERRLAAAVDARPELAAVVRIELFQAGNLERDLAALGVAPEGVEALPATAAFLEALEVEARGDPVTLLGALYVLEGSKNGSRFLALRLAGPLRLTPGRPGLLYFDPHGADQPRLWAQWKAGLDGLDLAPAQADAVLRFAVRAFEAIAAMDDQVHALTPAAAAAPGAPEPGR